MTVEQLRHHYEEYPYPHYPIFASIRTADTCHLNLEAIWTYFNHKLPPLDSRRILIAGCGTFAPYPFAVANPKTEILAIDLSKSSLNRARLHCALHRFFNLKFEKMDLCKLDSAWGKFGFIDAFGVLHHLDNPFFGLKSLAERLTTDGIMRIMIYSRHSRREEESIRRALRLLKITNLKRVQELLTSAPQGSRLYDFANSSIETSDKSEIADALLHPQVHTFVIDELVELIKSAGLSILRFGHNGALPNPENEIIRLKSMEKERISPGNFVLYLGKNRPKPLKSDKTVISLNNCLLKEVSRFTFGVTTLHSNFAINNPVVISPKTRSFLRLFRKPVPWHTLSEDVKKQVKLYHEAFILLHYAQE